MVDTKHWKVVLKSIDSKILDVVVKKITSVAQTNLVKCSAIALPGKQSLFTILKSPHVYKTTMDQYYLCERKRVIYLDFKNGQSIDLFRDIAIPAAVSIQVLPINK